MQLQAFINEKITEYLQQKGKKRTRNAQHDPTSMPIAGYPQFSDEKKDRRIRALIAKHGPAISGQGGHNHTLDLAHQILIGMICTPEETFRWMQEWNATLKDPWTDQEVWHKIDDAPTLGGEPGYLLNAQWTPPPDPEDAWWVGRVVRIRGTFRIWIIGPGVNDFRREWLPEHDPANIDLSDIAGLGVVEADRPTACDLAAAPDVAGDTRPPADTPTLSVYEPHPDLAGDRPHWCPYARSVGQDEIGGKSGVVRSLPCKSHDCPFCGPLIRTHWLTSIDTHLDAWAGKNGGDDTPSLWAFRCSPADWRGRVGHYIRYSSGQYMRMDSSCRGEFPDELPLIVSTILPPGVDAEQITPADAKQRLLTELLTMPACYRKGTFSGGGGWALLPDRDKKKPRFKNRIEIKHSDAVVLQVLNDLGADVEHFAGTGRFYPWRALRFNIRGKSMEYVWACLEAGQVLPEGWEDERTTVTSDGNGVWTFNLYRDAG